MKKEIKNNTLYFDGCNTLDLAKEYGTPLYVVSESEIVNRCSQLRKVFINKYENCRVAYASKAFICTAMAKIMEREGMCLDVVSGGELYTAIQANFPPEKVEFNGNNKLRSEIEMAVDYGIGRIIIDGLHELDLIEEVCKAKNKKMKVLYRITPGVKSSSHDYIVTGKKDSKFGIPLDNEVIMPAVKKAIDSKYVDFYGFHYHVGSQLFDNNSHIQALEILMKLIKSVKNEFGYDTLEINLGGGFGVTYVDEERKPFEYFLDPLMELIKKEFKAMEMAMPNVVIEPGRSMIAEAGLTLYTIGETKDIKDIRKYVTVDGGMTDNIRPALYQAIYDGIVANKAEEEKKDLVTVCGKCCESGDILIKDIKIAEPKKGDIFAIFSTGAYGYTMASNYNRNLVPPVVLVNKGKSSIIVKGQDMDDLLRNDVIPEYLK